MNPAKANKTYVPSKKEQKEAAENARKESTKPEPVENKSSSTSAAPAPFTSSAAPKP